MVFVGDIMIAQIAGIGFHTTCFSVKMIGYDLQIDAAYFIYMALDDFDIYDF